MESKEITILLVEDNPDHQLLAKMAIKRLEKKFSLIVCDDGETAIEKLEKGLIPDVILLDVVLMNEVNGFDIARHIRQIPQLEETCIILYTGYENPEYIANSKQVGAFAYLLKDDDMSVTVTKLKRIIESWQKERKS